MKAVTQAVAGAETEVSQKLGIKQTSKAEGEGLGGLIAAFFAGLTGIWGIIAVVAVVLIIGAVIFLLSPAGQESTVKLANAGASKIKGPMG
jgi:hypothetical protein